MNQKKNTSSYNETSGAGSARQWLIDFLIGIIMFALVAIFASIHTGEARPAPLAISHMATAQAASQGLKPKAASSMASPAIASNASTYGTAAGHHQPGGVNRLLMAFMALLFSAMLTISFYFWRSLSPSRTVSRRH